MKFLLHKDAGLSELRVSGDDYRYLIKVRRHKVGDLIPMRTPNNLVEEYRYRLERTDGREAYFSLQSHHRSIVQSPRNLHIGWCLVDPKTIEKTLPMLTELGVSKITFDFGGEVLQGDEVLETVVIGCEGGFDESERKLFGNYRVRVFTSPMILRSETAAVAIASRLL
ncbi:MAG: 16S rRNA (uracil(1498)-N(3))-methyltransferase [Epsilonproteobacteria bacterium]|nr:16S rRNA (uracil(1498)-N(3))-methyltransferase [Campylobacterota bacterium]